MSDTIKPKFADILSSIPGIFGIRLEEEPAYDIVDTIGDVEIRHYRPTLLASVTIAGDHDKALNEAFTKLARYIYGGNHDDEKMSMTSPVLQEISGGSDASGGTPVLRNADGSGWTVSFFLANDLQPAAVPAPDDASITLVVQPETHLASLRYSGNNTAARRSESRKELLEALGANSRWRVTDDVSWAQYDQPFAIPFLKRNEAHVAVTAT